MRYLSPSILAADFDRLEEQITQIRDAGVRYLHFDVMDGCFVPNISFGLPILSQVRSYTDLILDVHLMIEQPERYLKQVADCGADIITVHQEACKDLNGVISQIHELGKKAGVAIRPATPVSVLEPVLSKLDVALVMTVNPGFGGQRLIPHTLEKVQALRETITKLRLQVALEVDGGVNLRTLQSTIDAGADIIVAGSAVFKGDILANVNHLHGIIQKD